MKIPQGNKNHVVWALARKNQTKQTMIMYGIITIHTFTLVYPLDIPEYFDPSKWPKLECEQHVWFEKVHMENKTDHYPRLAIRFVSLTMRWLENWHWEVRVNMRQKIQTTFKYAGHAQFFLGVVAAKYLDGNVGSKRCKDSIIVRFFLWK